MRAAITWAVRLRLAEPRSALRKVPLFVLVLLYTAWLHIKALAS